MAAPPRDFGPADARPFYDFWIGERGALGKLFLCSLNVEPFVNNWVGPGALTCAYLAWFGNLKHRSATVPRNVTPTDIRIGLYADALGPMIAYDMIAVGEDARNMLINAVRALIIPDNLQVVSRADAAGYAGLPENQRAGDWPANAEVAMNFNTAMAILRYVGTVANHFVGTDGLTALVHVYVAVLKRGTLSMGFADKIRDGINLDLGKQITIVPEICQKFYAWFGDNIDGNTVAAITEHWKDMLPGHALRLKLTVQQAAGSGITALITVGKALYRYQDFPWGRIIQMYPTEVGIYEMGVAEVGNNVWFGFNKDLGNAKATGFRNLAYVAKELLIKVDGEAGLRAYGGWTNRAKYQAAVDVLIADYEQYVTQKAVNPDGLVLWPNCNDDRYLAIRRIITANAAVYQ